MYRNTKASKGTDAKTSKGTAPLAVNSGSLGSAERSMLLILLSAMVAVVILEVIFIEYMFSTATRQRPLAPPPPPQQQQHSSNQQPAEPDEEEEEEEEEEDASFDIEQLVQSAGVELTPELRASLPSRREVVKLYGSKPIIVGRETCAEFQATVKNEDAYIAPAGMFNTGTNLMKELLLANCYLPEKVKKLGKGSPGMRGQVPWGKHSPMAWRGGHVAESGGAGVVQEHVLPAVVIKDPYTWMTSMCRHPYSAVWRTVEGHCPNLVPLGTETNPHDLPDNGGSTYRVSVHYSKTNITHHESMAGLWNDWYGPWLSSKQSSFPRIVVRFEDLLFHPVETVSEVCHCGGGVMKDGPFHYVAESAKSGGSHQGSSSMISALTRYGNATLRMSSFSMPDFKHAKKTLRSDFMKLLHYNRLLGVMGLTSASSSKSFSSEKEVSVK